MGVIIGAVGNTPQVITEAVAYLPEIKEVHIIHTSSDDVMKNVEFLKKYTPHRFRVKIESVKMDKKDITSNNDIIEFMGIAANLVERIKNRDKYCLISGGRKSMSVALALAGQVGGARLAIHITHKGTSTFNPEWERNKLLLDKYLEGTINSEEKTILDNMMVPIPEDIDIIKIPLLPLPKDYIHVIRKAVLENKPRLAGKYFDELLESGWARSPQSFSDYDLLRRLFE